MSDDSNWISSRETQQRLNRGDRTLRNYVKRGNLHTRLRGRRIEYYLPDVERLAAELPEDDRQHVPDQDVLPAGRLLDHIRDLEQQLAKATAEIGYLRGQLESHQLQLSDAKQAQRLLVDKEREADDLRRQVEYATGGSRRRGQWNIVLAIFIILLVLTFILYFAGIIPR